MTVTMAFDNDKDNNANGKMTMATQLTTATTKLTTSMKNNLTTMTLYKQFRQQQ